MAEETKGIVLKDREAELKDKILELTNKLLHAIDVGDWDSYAGTYQ